MFLAISDQTDVGESSALSLALASSVLPRLRPLTRLAARGLLFGAVWHYLAHKRKRARK